MTLRVSVVVPTYRRADLLARCLAALLAQDFNPEQYEILVCDDAASARTQTQVEGYASSVAAPAIRYLAVRGKHGPAAARNVGWQTACAPMIAFTDEDCMPHRGWLQAGVAAFAEGIDALWGTVRVPRPEHPTDFDRNEAGMARAGFVTANCFCRRDVLKRVGGFDERFTMAWREDSDLYFTMLEHGCTVRHAPAAVVVHPVRPARWAVCLSQQRKSAFNALLYKKHPELYRRYVQARPPWSYYAIATLLLLSPLAAVAGYPLLAAAAALTWLGLTARFCARRLRGTSHAPRHVAEMIVTSAIVPLLSIHWRLRGAARFRVPFF
jgi:glycosyltransferase involved in cell wall biosynthesis